jgi:large subunit ribosomal protein L24
MVPKSSKARKQRKFLYNAPLHVRRKLLSAHLSKELQEKYKRRSFPVKVGDEVEVMRGEFKKRTGKVAKVDLKKYKVYIEGLTRKKVEGREKMVPIHPSNLRIINLNLEDKKRVEALERKLKIGESYGEKAKSS